MSDIVPIPQRRFGRTNLNISVLSCGGMRFQQGWDDLPWEKITADEQERLRSTIARAFEIGINHIETARGYGSSERQLSKVLTDYPRDTYYLQTKVGPKPSAKEFEETLQHSFDTLGVDYVDFLSLHGINNEELLQQSICRGGCLEVLRRWQRDQRIRHVGFSTHSALPVIRQALATGEFDYFNLHWYFVNQINWPAIEDAEKNDVGVFIISPNDKGGKLYAPSDKLRELCLPLHPMQFNNLFCLSYPQVHTLSLGASKPSDFDLHQETFQRQQEFEPHLQRIQNNIQQAVTEKCGPNWEDLFSSRVPSFEEFPGQVNVREILREIIWAKGLDLWGYARDRYNLLGNGGHWFPGAQLSDDTDWVGIGGILEQHQLDSARILDLLREAQTALKGEEKKRQMDGE
ncbi:MAG: aldo/keto reductase [Verrucomicrobiales bacterium]